MLNRLLNKFSIALLTSILLAGCGNSSYQPSRSLNETTNPIKSIMIQPEKPDIKVGQTAQLTALITQPDGEFLKDVPISWISSNSSIATIDTKGLIKAIAEGRTDITATVLGQKSTISIIVNSATSSTGKTAAEIAAGKTSTAASSAQSLISKVIIKPYNYDAIPGEIVLNGLSENMKFIATAYDAQEAIVSSATFTWASSDKTIATVDPTEIINEATVKSLKTGTTDITATAGDKVSNKIKVTVPAGKININFSFMLP